MKLSTYIDCKYGLKFYIKV